VGAVRDNKHNIKIRATEDEEWVIEKYERMLRAKQEELEEKKRRRAAMAAQRRRVQGAH
jgi:phosphoenolpyruvate synthase/pyruvate phosphate dikinase